MKNKRILSFLPKQWLAPILLCVSTYLLPTVAQTDKNEAVTNLPTDQDRIQAAKRSVFILGTCGLVFGLLNLICCSISIHKAIRDRKAIISRNLARRKAKEFAKGDHSRLLLSDQQKFLTGEPKMTSVVHQVLNQNTTRYPAVNQITIEPASKYVTYRSSQPYLRPQDPVTHHFSRSPKLRRAKVNPDVRDQDASNNNSESHAGSRGTYSHLSAYPKPTLPPLASYNNL